MGKTPRQRLTQLPMPTRSTEASSECFGRVVLSYLREDEQKPASFFILGDVLHRAIEITIREDYDLDQSLALAQDMIFGELAHLKGQDVLESSERSIETMPDDARRMIHNWFTYVHPDSKKRHPVYDDYDWPPAGLEVPFRLPARAGTKYPVWGSVDALLHGKRGFRIVDWKSGVKRPSSDFQLNFYRFGLGLTAKANYHMLDRVRKPSIVVEADDYPGDTAIREQIVELERQKDRVIEGEVPRFRPDWYCAYCPVQDLCPANNGITIKERSKRGRELKQLLKTVEPMEVIE